MLAKKCSSTSKTLFEFCFLSCSSYGHGVLKDVSQRMVSIVTVLSSTLFLVVCGKLVLVLSCKESEDNSAGPFVLMLDERVMCWQGMHPHAAAAALIAFGFYVPLCAVVAPLLREPEVSRLLSVLPAFCVVPVHTLNWLLAMLTGCGGGDRGRRAPRPQAGAEGDEGSRRTRRMGKRQR